MNMINCIISLWHNYITTTVYGLEHPMGLLIENECVSFYYRKFSFTGMHQRSGKTGICHNKMIQFSVCKSFN